MDNIKPSQNFQRTIKIVLVLFLLSVVYLLYTNKKQMNAPVQNIFTMIPVEVKPVKNNPSYQAVTGMLNLHHWELENGAKVYFVPTPHLPMLDIDMTFDAGAARDKNGKSGLAFLTNHLLLEGSGNISADDMAIKLDELGVEMSTQSHRDMAVLHLRTLTDATVLDKAVELLSQIAGQPSFPEKALEREKNNTLIALKAEKQSPGKVAARAFFETLYQDAPYRNWKLGQEPDIQSLTAADLKAFHQQYYSAANAVITLVGAIDVEQANKIAHQLAAYLPKGERAAKVVVPGALTKPHEQQISFPSEQVHIMIGSLGMTRDDKDYYPLYVGNHILGGGSLTSRIFDIVRNQHGLAYSAYSYFLPMRSTGPFIMSCQTRGDQADKAQDLMLDALSDFIEKGPTEDELKLAKQNLIGGYALNFDTNYGISREVSSLGFYNLPLDTFNQYKDNIEKLKTSDIQAAFKARLSKENLVVLSVGNRA